MATFTETTEKTATDADEPGERRGAGNAPGMVGLMHKLVTGCENLGEAGYGGVTGSS
jgi:hypothetical protein